MAKSTKNNKLIAALWGLDLVFVFVWFVYGLPTMLNGGDFSILASLVISVFVIIFSVPFLIEQFETLKKVLKRTSN